MYAFLLHPTHVLPGHAYCVDVDVQYAKDVEQSGKEKSIPFLSSSDRRLIHMHIQENYPNLSSASKGEGQGRQLVIAPKSDKA